MSQNLVILVTGAAGGIGLATVRTLIEEYGAKVAATDIVAGGLSDLKTKYPESLEIIVGDIVDVRIFTY